jgi:magnesium-transporting ATPase (P-type)
LTKRAKVQERNNEEHDVDRLVNEISWTFKRAWILLKNWTMPVISPATTPSRDDGVSARALALAVIVGLTFAVRGEPLGSNRAAFTAMVGVLAAISSFGLSTAIQHFNLQKKFNVKSRDRWLISAYVSLIGVMFLFVFLQTFLTGFDWYQMLSEAIGVTLFPIILAVVVTFVLLFLKARIFDKNRIGLLAAIHGAIVVSVCGIITFGISALSNEGFNVVIDWISRR